MKKSGRTNKKAYVCGLYARAGKNFCSSHHIPLATIEEIVLRDIRSKIILTIDEEKAKQIFLAHKTGQQAKQNAADTKRLRTVERRLTELDRLIHATHEDKVMGRVPEEMCISLLNDYQQEKKKLTAELDMLKQSIEAVKQDSSDVDEFIKRLKSFENAEVLTREMCNEFIRRLKKYAEFKELTREMALDLIEYITIDECIPRSTEPRTVHIYYKFLDKPLKNKNNALK
jgi:resolvase, N-terminal domain protein